jgi:hypothetical protein
MTWRKWFVRGLVFASTASMAAAAFVYHYWTNPAMIRQEVIAKLSEHLTGAEVRLQGAHLRLLDGISFSELRLTRRDDASQNVFFYVPRGIIYHDKEQLRSGRLVIRRIVLDQAAIHVMRDRNGRWNLSGILAPPRPDIAIPTIVFHRAAIKVEDEAAGVAPVEIKDVNLTFINDPLPTLKFEGDGLSDLGGAIQVRQSSWGRRSDEVSLHVRMPQVPVSGRLIGRLAAYCPKLAEHVKTLQAAAELEASFHYDPKAPRPWTNELRARLHDGTFTHSALPFRLEKLEAEFHGVNDQFSLDRLEARSGPTLVELTGRGTLGSANYGAVLKMEHLTYTPELLGRLPAELREIESRFHPSGVFSFIYETHHQGEHSTQHCMIRPEEMSATYSEFPYRLDRVSGLIEHENDTAKRVERITMDLTGYSSSKPVFIQGTVLEGKPASYNLHVWGNNIVLDERLCRALDPAQQKLVRSFRPEGLADIDAVVHRAPRDRKNQGHYLIRFHDCSSCYDLFPYPVDSVSGTLDIQPDYWECRDFQGRHNGAEVRCRGGAAKVKGENRLRIEIRGGNLPIDEELHVALKPHPGLRSAWAKLSPSGSMDFEAVVKQVAENDPDIEVTVVPQRARLRPTFFPYDLADLNGRVHYHDHLVELDHLRARHGRSVFTLEQGRVFLKGAAVGQPQEKEATVAARELAITSKPMSGVIVNLANLAANPVIPDGSFREALPPALGKAVDALDLRDALAMRTDLVIDIPVDERAPPYIYWDGYVDLYEANLHPGVSLQHVTGRVACRGNHQGNFGNVAGNLQLQQLYLYQQPFVGVHGRIVVNEAQPDVLLLPNFEAKLFGGDLGGSVRIELGDRPTYEADLTATQMQLEEFGRHNHLSPRKQLKGMAAARLYLKGSGSSIDGLSGAGRFDVESGKMYDLPLLLDLLKFLNLRMPDPDHTAFEDAHAQFQIHGPVISITRLDLIGSAITLGGKGALRVGDAGSEIDMELYAVWAPLQQLTPLPLKSIWPAVSKQFLKIRMKGKIGETPRFEKVPIPPVTEPLKGLWQRMEGRRS